jgi:hypothetical protein
MDNGEVKKSEVEEYHNYSPLKIRGVPPKAGRCYDVIDN